MLTKLAVIRNRRFVVPSSVEETLMRVNAAGCNVSPATYKKYESGLLPLNKKDVIEALSDYYGVSPAFFFENHLDLTLSFAIPELLDFEKNKTNKWVPVYDDFYNSLRHFETIEYPYLICNLVRYNGYHLLLNGDAFDLRRRATEEYQQMVGRPKGFSDRSARNAGMGLAYVDDNFQFVTPFSGNILPDKTFAGICIEDWSEFKKDIWSRDSRYRQFLDLLTDDDEETVTTNCIKVEY